MVSAWLALVAAFLAAVGEALQWQRLRRVAFLAFGPSQRPRAWVFAVPPLRVAACATLAWGLSTLALIPPAAHGVEEIPEGSERHLVLVLDVSPSMRLVDAGPESNQSRLRRTSVLLESFFQRIPLQHYRVSVIAVYSGAKQVVVDTRDLEVVRNILDDLPLHHAFESGQTQLLSGLEEAAELSRPWNPRSALVVVVSDGDTVPTSGMPKMPVAVSDVLVVGVGDPHVGKMIEGRHSRQDARTLRQVAARLGGVYHDGNRRHLSSETIGGLTQLAQAKPWERLTLREYALLAIGTAAAILALIPLLLHLGGTPWAAGRRIRQAVGTRERVVVT